MKRLMTGLFFVMILSIQMHAQSDTLRFEPDGNAADSVEYELIVLDPGYEMFLATQPHMEFYSQQYYENWNLQYVTEWNLRYSQPLVYGDGYQTYIDYRPNIDYGMELNYRLYYYFRFYEKENGVDLLPGRLR